MHSFDSPGCRQDYGERSRSNAQTCGKNVQDEDSAANGLVKIADDQVAACHGRGDGRRDQGAAPRVTFNDVASSDRFSDPLSAMKAMMKMNRQLNLPAIQKIMMEFERQSEIMEMKEETIGDTSA